MEPIRREPEAHTGITAGLLLLLQGAVLLFSLSSVMMKLAGTAPLFSLRSFLFYALGIALLGIYAICWQQFLKRMPLSVAYANRAMSMLWSMVFGYFLFGETIRWNMIAGTVVIASGIWLMVTDHGK